MPEFSGQFTINKWTEDAHKETKSPQKSHTADVIYDVKGDLKGQLAGRYVMHYNNEQFASYAGVLNFKGELGGKLGTFAIIETGTYADKSIHAKWQVVPQSGTGELSHISGYGEFNAPEAKTVEFKLNVGGVA